MRGKPFKKGNPGKPPGAKNHLTKTVKEAVLIAFDELQKDGKVNLIAWGKSNPTAFYQVAAKLIPTEVTGLVQADNLIVYIPDKKKDPDNSLDGID